MYKNTPCEAPEDDERIGRVINSSYKMMSSYLDYRAFPDRSIVMPVPLLTSKGSQGEMRLSINISRDLPLSPRCGMAASTLAKLRV